MRGSVEGKCWTLEALYGVDPIEALYGVDPIGGAYIASCPCRPYMAFCPSRDLHVVVEGPWGPQGPLWVLKGPLVVVGARRDHWTPYRGPLDPPIGRGP